MFGGLRSSYGDEAAELMEASGMLVKAPNTGTPIQSPYLAIVNRQTEIARKLASELSLSPVERSRLGEPPPDPADDEWAQFLRR